MPDAARLAALQRMIEQFRVDAERFFNGALPIPPEDQRDRIQRELRELREVAMRGAADQFRLAGLEARFNSLSEFFGRRLREREEGRGSAPPPRATPDEGRSYDPQQGIVVSSRSEPGAIEALWGGLAAAGAGARIELEAFRGYIARQIAEIRSKTGSENVLFRVVQEEGKLKLKAKPLAGENK